MRRSGWILSIAILVGFVLFQHHSVPNLPLPSASTRVGNEIQIPVRTGVVPKAAEVWNLTRRASGQYSVNVYSNYRLLHQYTANQTRKHNTSGTDYTALGDIRLGGVTYRAVQIHINPDGTSGYIRFKPTAQSTAAN